MSRDILNSAGEGCSLRRVGNGIPIEASTKETKVAATLRFLQFLSLGCWLGAIVFFSFVVTQGAFSLLPTSDLAGALVGYTLTRLHLIGIAAGCLYLIATIALEKSIAALARPAALLVFLMVLCTVLSQYVVISRMDALRLQMGSVAATAAGNPLRVAFDRLHQYSVWLESVVLFSGLAALFLTARQKSP